MSSSSCLLGTKRVWTRSLPVFISQLDPKEISPRHVLRGSAAHKLAAIPEAAKIGSFTIKTKGLLQVLGRFTGTRRSINQQPTAGTHAPLTALPNMQRNKRQNQQQHGWSQGETTCRLEAKVVQETLSMKPRYPIEQEN